MIASYKPITRLRWCEDIIHFQHHCDGECAVDRHDHRFVRGIFYDLTFTPINWPQKYM